MMSSKKENITIDISSLITKIEDALYHLKNINLSQILINDRARLNSIYEKLGFLVTALEIHNKNAYFEYKIDDYLWSDNILLKYLFEDCITYASNQHGGKSQLHCLTCKNFFFSSVQSLYQHLNDPSHIFSFKADREGKMDAFFANDPLYKFAFEKFIDHRADNTLYCRICASIMPCKTINLLGHINGEKHLKNFTDIFRFKFDCNRTATASLSSISDSRENGNIFMSYSNDQSGKECSVYQEARNFNSPPTTTVGRKSVEGNGCENVEVKKNELKEYLGLFMKDMLRNKSKLTGKKGSNLKLYCYPCSKWIADDNGRMFHLKSEKHIKHISSNSNYKSFECKCLVQFVCDEKFFDDHKKSDEHKVIERFITHTVNKQKEKNRSSGNLCTNVSPDMEHSLMPDLSIKSNVTDHLNDDSQNSDTNSEDECSDSSSHKDSINSRGSKHSLKSRSKIVYSYWYGLQGNFLFLCFWLH